MEDKDKKDVDQSAPEKETTKKEAPKSKKKEKGEEALVKNSIEINPSLDEAKNATAVIGWGRMNPITSGHEKLVNKIKDVARKESATPLVYLTHSQDAKKNPLSYDDKVMLAQKAFGNIIVKSKSKTIIQAMQELQKKFNKVVLVVGGDRVKDFDALLNKYNGKDYNFDSISVVSAGDRTDPDSDDAKQMTADTMSASVMRKLAVQGDFDTFKKGLPKKLRSVAKDVYDMVRGGMKLAEEMELSEAPLNFAQRRQRALTMRKYKSKIAAARRRMSKRTATKEKLQQRARKQAIKMIRAKVAGEKGANYSTLSSAEKMVIDKKVAKRKAVIDRIAKKILPKVRKADLARVAGKTVSEELDLDMQFEQLFEAEVKQDKDIKDREGTQPAKYHKGLAPSTKEKRDAHFKKGAKMDDDNPEAYKKAPGDADAKTKESKHTKKYKEMYGEEVADAPVKKRFHSAQKKDGSVKLDGRFKIFKKKNQSLDEIEIKTDAERRLKQQHKNERTQMKDEHEREMDSLLARELRRKASSLKNEEFVEEFNSDSELIAFIEEVAQDISESIDLDEAKSMEGLKKKAEKSGVSYGILKKVYDRGVAAWRTGHRPGTTPQQWGYARVNSFLTGGKTRTTADKDLWAKAKTQKEEKEVPNCVAEEVSLDEQFLYMELDEDFAKDWKELSTPKLIAKLKSVTVAKKKYEYAKKLTQQIYDRKKAEGGPKHGIGYYASNIARQVPGVDAKILARSLGEEFGAGFEGTDTMVQNYKEQTPGEKGKKKKPKISDWSPEINEAFEEMLDEDVSQKQIQDLEKFADRLLAKFDVDIEFTRHFADRMNDDRNNPKISIPELQRVFKKIAKNKAKDIKKNGDTEAVLKDMQADLNLPVVIKYNRKDDEFEVVNKTIMRKKNFKTSNKVIEY